MNDVERQQDIQDGRQRQDIDRRQHEIDEPRQRQVAAGTMWRQAIQGDRRPGALRRAGFLLAAILLLLAPPAVALAGTGSESAAPLPGKAVNINTADDAQLQLLPGIGPKKAAAIMAQRQLRPFRSVDDLARVRGIGRKTVQRLRSLATVDAVPAPAMAGHLAARPAPAGNAAPANSVALAVATAGERPRCTLGADHRVAAGAGPSAGVRSVHR